LEAKKVTRADIELLDIGIYRSVSSGIDFKNYTNRFEWADLNELYSNTSKRSRFVSWNTQPNGQGTTYKPGDIWASDEVDGDTLDLYAQYIEVAAYEEKNYLADYESLMEKNNGKTLVSQRMIQILLAYYSNGGEFEVKQFDYGNNTYNWASFCSNDLNLAMDESRPDYTWARDISELTGTDLDALQDFGSIYNGNHSIEWFFDDNAQFVAYYDYTSNIIYYRDTDIVYLPSVGIQFYNNLSRDTLKYFIYHKDQALLNGGILQ
jgi:hypothetical protein